MAKIIVKDRNIHRNFSDYQAIPTDAQWKITLNVVYTRKNSYGQLLKNLHWYQSLHRLLSPGKTFFIVFLENSFQSGSVGFG